MTSRIPKTAFSAQEHAWREERAICCEGVKRRRLQEEGEKEEKGVWREEEGEGE